MGTVAPRAVFVTRETDYELLLARHATREQARFFLETRGQKLVDLETRHERFQEVLREARSQVPADWRQTHLRRMDLDRFLFAPDDVIVVVGQDGLVANVAKYVGDQPVLGVNPLPERYEGILVRIPLVRLGSILTATAAGDVAIEARTMAEAVLENGERLLALNEIFIGHRSHQSARYSIAIGSTTEEQSSSGIIAATGTGATGWARSIMKATNTQFELTPPERALAYFVREPFPSISTGTSIRCGKLETEALRVTSHMNDGGVIFADGIEQDFLTFDWGRQVELRPSSQSLHLVQI